jgi:diguanylate cyclase (GGDEF)-like protein
VETAGHHRQFRARLCGWLFLGLCTAAAAAAPDTVTEQLKKADGLRTSDYAQFSSILESVAGRQSSLTPAQREYLSYLEAWKSAYDTDTPTAVARLTALLRDSPDPNIRARSGATAVNILVFGKRYEEAFAKMSVVLQTLPEVTDGVARQTALLDAAVLYNGVGQYDLALSYAQQVIDTNWGGRGFCAGWLQKLTSIYGSDRVSGVGQEFRAAIDGCVKTGEVAYANAIRVIVAQQYVKLNQLDEAIVLLKEHYEEAKTSHNPRLMAYWEATLADAYHRTGMAALAQQYATDVAAGTTTPRDEYTEPLVTALQVLYELAKERGDLKAALAFHEQFAAADKAYLTDLSARHLAFQKVNHENIANKLEVEALNRQNHVLQLERELGGKAVETSRLYILLLAMTVLFIGLWAYRTKKSQLHFQTLSRLDGLTGICNRPYFIAQAEKALEASRRTGEHLCLILCDLDHFKSINDRFGHATGDFVLKRTVSACKVHLNKGEVFGRFGGEEFAILLPGCGPEEAQQRAEQLRIAITAITAHQGQGAAKATVSASFGVAATGSSGHHLGQLLAHADAALYEAKRIGRNRVVLHSHTPGSESTQLALVPTADEFVQFNRSSSSN